MSNGSLGNDLLKVSLFSNKVPSGSSSVIFTAIHFSISVLCMFESWSRHCFHRSNASLMLSISRRWVERDSMLLIVKWLHSRRTLSVCGTNLIIRKQSNQLIKFCLLGDFVSFISRMRYIPLHHSYITYPQFLYNSAERCYHWRRFQFPPAETTKNVWEAKKVYFLHWPI